ncbi:enolase C-terminal domain-like protein [Alphaproteobacteria bacterium]|nr:enolase C-terminal domain-like protein [Alphaproteobacteria bacterium]
MKQKIKIQFSKKVWQLKEEFKTSNRSKDTDQVEAIEVIIKSNGYIGRGESTPYIRYGENISNSIQELNKIKPFVENGMSRKMIQFKMSPSSARCALDCAMWDLEAKEKKRAIWQLLKIKKKPLPLKTTESYGIRPLKKLQNDIERDNYPSLIKLKANSENVLDIVKTVNKISKYSKLIIDFNESLSPNEIIPLSNKLKKFNIIMLEQPLHEKQDNILSTFKHPIPIGADESCHTADDLLKLKNKYDYVIIKPGKCGGLTEALKLKRLAEKNQFSTMIVCMFGSSLAVAPAYFLSLDGANINNIEVPKIMLDDRKHKIKCQNQLIFPPDQRLWG